MLINTIHKHRTVKYCGKCYMLWKLARISSPARVDYARWYGQKTNQWLWLKTNQQTNNKKATNNNAIEFSPFYIKIKNEK